MVSGFIPVRTRIAHPEMLRARQTPPPAAGPPKSGANPQRAMPRRKGKESN